MKITRRMSILSRRYSLLPMAAVLLAACSGDDSTSSQAAGTERGACRSGRTCDPGLVCLSDVCVRMPDGGPAATGGESNGTGGAATGGGSASGGASGGGATAGGSSGDGGSAGSAGTSGTGGAAGSSTGGSAGGANCPDVFGTYGTITTLGAGCGDINASAPQCIKGTTSACALHFTSVVPGGGPGAVNGGANLKSDGTFEGASIILGSVQRSGCIGSWSESSSTMEVTCGGTGSSQSCTVSLVRTSTTCP